jgi:hypothetical protein
MSTDSTQTEEHAMPAANPFQSLELDIVVLLRMGWTQTAIASAVGLTQRQLSDLLADHAKAAGITLPDPLTDHWLQQKFAA